MNATRRLWQTLYRLRFLLWQRHRHNRLVLEWVAQRPFLILPEVFNPTLFFTSEFMVSSFNAQLIPPGSRVLDLGAGSGVGAIFAAQFARQGTTGSVTAVDINPTAVRCARINVLLNEVEGCVDVREGDLFAPVSNEQFDVILFNPPYYRNEPNSRLDQAFHAVDVIERFTAELPHHLTTTGYALVLLSSTGDEAAFLRLFAKQGLEITLAAQQTLLTEVITLYQLKPVKPD
jgi:release factor glutamine methyltransferase